MKVRNIMIKKVVSFYPDDSLLDISKKMAKRKISCVIILDSEKHPIGIITERDINSKVVAKDLKPSRLKARDVMTSPVYAIPDASDFLSAMEIMKKKNIRRLPVIKDGKLVGIITQTDLLKKSASYFDSVSDRIDKLLNKL